jgi:4-azaleucine resistance transporter AzlC
MIYFYWVAGTAIGSMAGMLITFDTTGLDFAMTALFIVLFTEYWKKKENRSAAAMGVLASLTALLVFDGVTFMIPAMLLMLMAVFVRKKI